MQISRYERGLGLPAADTLVAIASVLRISLDTLLLGKADRLREDLPIKNIVLLEQLQELQRLDRKDQAMIVELIRSVLARRGLEARSARRG